jgi:hypothetical protein
MKSEIAGIQMKNAHPLLINNKKFSSTCRLLDDFASQEGIGAKGMQNSKVNEAVLRLEEIYRIANGKGYNWVNCEMDYERVLGILDARDCVRENVEIFAQSCSNSGKRKSQ